MAQGREDRGGRTVVRQAFGGGASGAKARVAPQRRQARKDGWTRAQEETFLQSLAATCNVSESAKAAGKCSSSVYYHKQHDPAFARAWGQALEVGYAELEALLLRELLFGSEQEELVLDAEGAVKSRKIKRGRNLGIALRLLLHHAQAVARVRAEQMRDPPDGDDAIARMNKLLDAVRQRRAELGE